MRFDEIDVAGCADRRAVRDAIFVGRGGVAQPRAGQIHGREAVVVELDVVLQWRIGVGQEFVDHDRAHRISADGFGASGRTVDGVAGRPGEDALLAVAGA